MDVKVVHSRRKFYFFKVVNRTTGGKLASKILGERKLLNILNKVECEAHREVLIAGLKDYMGR